MKCSLLNPPCHKNYSRSPCGERGLKYRVLVLVLVLVQVLVQSLPVRGAWIEIC